MSPLLKARVAEEAPFTYTSVDYFGPMMIKDENDEILKVYGVVFVCLVTRAIHLEAARDLSANKFLMALE